MRSVIESSRSRQASADRGAAKSKSARPIGRAERLARWATADGSVQAWRAFLFVIDRSMARTYVSGLKAKSQDASRPRQARPTNTATSNRNIAVKRAGWSFIV